MADQGKIKLVSDEADADTPNKAAVQGFMDTLFNRRDPREAVRRFVGPRYVQHNPEIGDGPEGLCAFVDRLLPEVPDLKLEIKRLVGEGDYVLAQVHVVPMPGDRGMASMDLFRLEDGRIVEHWDTAQPVPEKSANENTMF
jgi:predicted SnoaL-like aldol condensation-catalyzing enzyme